MMTKHARTDNKSTSAPDRRIPPGAMSLYETTEHKFKGAGKWFRTQYLADQYAERDRCYKRARRAGFGTTPEELEKFREWEKVKNDLIQEKKDIKARERQERDALREKYGAHPNAQVSRLDATEKAARESRVYLAKANRRRLSDSERLNSMRALYRQRNQMSPADLLIRLGNYLGEEL